MSDEPRDPGPEDVMRLLIETVLARARAMLPARIEAYDEIKQSASVQILVMEAHIDEEGTRQPVALNQLHDVPVWQFGGSSGRITVPVKKGDVGMAVFASSSIARQKLIGGIVDPSDDRHHNINDCYFVPGGHDFAHVPTTAPTDAIVTHGATKLGGPDADKAVTRTNDVEDALKGALSDSTIAGAILAIGAPGGPAALVTAVNAYFAANPVGGATLVKAK